MPSIPSLPSEKPPSANASAIEASQSRGEPEPTLAFTLGTGDRRRASAIWQSANPAPMTSVGPPSNVSTSTDSSAESIALK